MEYSIPIDRSTIKISSRAGQTVMSVPGVPDAHIAIEFDHRDNKVAANLCGEMHDYVDNAGHIVTMHGKATKQGRGANERCWEALAAVNLNMCAEDAVKLIEELERSSGELWVVSAVVDPSIRSEEIEKLLEELMHIIVEGGGIVFSSKYEINVPTQVIHTDGW